MLHILLIQIFVQVQETLPRKYFGKLYKETKAVVSPSSCDSRHHNLLGFFTGIISFKLSHFFVKVKSYLMAKALVELED